MKSKLLTTTALFAAAALLTACSSTQKSGDTAMGVVNSKCPYSGTPIDANVTSNVGDATVGFCCNGCKTKFDALDATKKAEMVAKAKSTK
jgi:hypothetical protein